MGKNRDSAPNEEVEERDEEETESKDDTESSSTKDDDESSSQQSDDNDDSSSDESSEDDDEEFDEARARRTIKHLRAREKELKGQVKELRPFKSKAEKAEKDRARKERESMGEVERLTKDSEEAQDTIKELRSENNRLMKREQRRNFLDQTGWDTKQARRLFNALPDLDVEWKTDKDGKTTNMDAIKKAARKYDSDLFGPGSVNGGERDESDAQPADMNTRLKAALGG